MCCHFARVRHTGHCICTANASLIHLRIAQASALANEAAITKTHLRATEDVPTAHGRGIDRRL